MNCFDCATDAPSEIRRAIATCVHCGAAPCTEHATVTLHHLTRVQPLNQIVAVEPAARRIYCPTCAAAIQAQAHPPAHATHFPHRHR
jgi:hypothetical protein